MKRIQTAEIQPFEERHEKQMRMIAPECMVLLKKDGSFPLKEAGKLALYGNGARNTVKGGTGSGDVNVRHFVTIQEGLTHAGFTITSLEWLDAYDRIYEEAQQAFVRSVKEEAKEKGVSARMLGMGKVMPEPDYEIPCTAEGDTAIYVLSRECGEGADRTVEKGDIRLTDTETRDILFLNESYERFMLVLNVGGLVDLSGVRKVKNILLLGQLGTVTGDALADVLTGKSYPSGKLAATWAALEDYPSTEGFGALHDTYYKEGIYVGYRYFDSTAKKVDFPFGYGLGYTSFSMETENFAADEKNVSVSIRVKNTGNFAGREVTQVYVSAPQGRLDQPCKELRAFQKSHELLPGEEEVLKLSFPTAALASYCEEMAAWIMEPGAYGVYVGAHSADTRLCGRIRLSGQAVIKKCEHAGGSCGFTDWKPEVGSSDGMKDEIQLSVPETVIASVHTENAENGQEKESQSSKREFLSQLTEKQLACLCIGAYQEGGMKSVIGNAGQKVAGAAGETTGELSGHGIKSLIMADGPAGLRLSRKYILDGEDAQGLESFMPATMLKFMEAEEIEMLNRLTGPKRSFSEEELYYQYCTAIPIGMSVAQSWNEEVCRRLGDVVGEEMELFGINLWLAPALNIYRSPLCGRNFEYYSEDPLLSGQMAAGMTEGVQRHCGCGVTIKHFACNNQETNRYFSNSCVSERALREIYLKGFEICVKKAQPTALMTSFNLINGEHACSRSDLLTQVLRKEWGFKGIVMTDWLVTGGMGKDGGKYPCASSAGCIRAGNDLIMPGDTPDMEDIMEALEDREHPYHLTREDLELCAERILELIDRLEACP